MLYYFEFYGEILHLFKTDKIIFNPSITPLTKQNNIFVILNF